MNVSEYIASGILEVYALGELPSSEASEVEAMALRYPEVSQEISGIQAVYEELANQWPVAPRPTLKQDVMDRLLGSTSEQTISSDSTSPTEAPAPGAASFNTVATDHPKADAAPPVSSSSLHSIRPFQLGIAASMLIAVASAVAAFYFWSQWRDTKQELDQVVAQNQRMASQYEITRQRTQQLESELTVVESPDFQSIALAGTDVSPESTARVYWNRTSSEVYLRAGTLPPPPPNQQYQLWAIVDDQPVSAGVFDVVEGKQIPLQVMSEAIDNAAAFAITLEPSGGSESPTLEAMYVQGAVADT